MKTSWQNVGFVIPALNEEGAIGGVVAGLRSRGISHIVVCDNGSIDRTAEVAQSAGAAVVHEPERGYGAVASSMKIEAIDEIIGFVDGDGSDDLDDLDALLSPVLNDEADFVIASRALGRAERGALTPPNALGTGSPLVAQIPLWTKYLTLVPSEPSQRRLPTPSDARPQLWLDHRNANQSGKAQTPLR